MYQSQAVPARFASEPCHHAEGFSAGGHVRLPSWVLWSWNQLHRLSTERFRRDGRPGNLQALPSGQLLQRFCNDLRVHLRKHAWSIRQQELPMQSRHPTFGGQVRALQRAPSRMQRPRTTCSRSTSDARICTPPAAIGQGLPLSDPPALCEHHDVGVQDWLHVLQPYLRAVAVRHAW